MFDTEGAKFALERLEEDHAIWARSREEKDITQLIKRVRQLEFDVSILMSDCFCLSHEYEESDIEGFHLAYVHMNALFQDLKKARRNLDKEYISSEELSELEIDWGRFRKSIEKIQKHLQDEKPLQS
jgi:hypothetical protein